MSNEIKTFVTADLHFECNDLIRDLRSGWATPEDHTLVTTSIINAVVGRHDRLFILGDFADRKSNVMALRQLINCRHIEIILGNHDHRNRMAKVFGADRVHDVKLVKVGPKDNRSLVWLSHYAHAYWPQSHCGSYHVYGHTHSEHELDLSVMMPGRRSMDVGIDNAFKVLGAPRPFRLECVVRCLSQSPGHHRPKNGRSVCSDV